MIFRLRQVLHAPTRGPLDVPMLGSCCGCGGAALSGAGRSVCKRRPLSVKGGLFSIATTVNAARSQMSCYLFEAFKQWRWMRRKSDWSRNPSSRPPRKRIDAGLELGFQSLLSVLNHRAKKSLYQKKIQKCPTSSNLPFFKDKYGGVAMLRGYTRQ